MTIKVDDTDFQKRIGDIVGKRLPSAQTQAVHDIASDILRRSGSTVPHDKGLLQNSGNVVDEPEQSIVGYNKTYASRLHEHPEYSFQKGRRGKWLELTIKENLGIFVKYYKEMMTNIFQ